MARRHGLPEARGAADRSHPQGPSDVIRSLNPEGDIGT